MNTSWQQKMTNFLQGLKAPFRAKRSDENKDKCPKPGLEMDDGIVIKAHGMRQDIYIDKEKNRSVVLYIESPRGEGQKLWICYLDRTRKWSDGSEITDEDLKKIERNIKISGAKEGYEGFLNLIKN